MSVKINNLTKRVNFSSKKKVIDVPDLLSIQTDSYAQFIQAGVNPDKRENIGLEEILSDIFPIEDFNGAATLEYLGYVLEAPRYSPREAIDRSTNYAASLKINVRLVVYEEMEGSSEKVIKSAQEMFVYLSDLPLMTEFGTFIINGVERVVINQLHRSPGIFFEDLTLEKATSERHVYSARIIPYRGSWIDFEYDTKNLMHVRIDKKRKMLVTVLLQAYGLTRQEILETYYAKEIVSVKGENKFKIGLDYDKIADKRLGFHILDSKGEVVIEENSKLTPGLIRKLKRTEITSTIIDRNAICTQYFAEPVVNGDGEVLFDANTLITDQVLIELGEQGIKKFTVLVVDNSFIGGIRDILAMDKVTTHEEALLHVHSRLRPGEPATVETAQSLFDNTFNNPRRYDMSTVGRIKINRRLGIDTTAVTLTREDLVGAIRVLEAIRAGNDTVDDRDHLGHRRVKNAGEQLKNYMRIGLARMEKTVKERMVIGSISDMSPHDLINAKPLSASIKEFFGSYQLSQFMDQTNPLAEITNKRRLSALGPGGLNRERAGFDVRDVHTSHYGRICPIETPEGPNIGLITSLTTYAMVNHYGFIETPYLKVEDGKVGEEAIYMSAMDEEDYYIAQASTELDDNGVISETMVSARHGGEAIIVPVSQIQYMDVSPMQMVSISTACIPFLEHDDANRALMGSNMQRQAVPLLRALSPIVGTGMEHKVAVDAGAVIVAKHDGTIDYVDGRTIIVRYGKKGNYAIDIFDLIKYRRSNQDTCINYRPVVGIGQSVKKGDTIADGPSTERGELALGKNIVVALMPWMGYNYEDSILVSQNLLKDDTFTSVHIEAYDVEARDTKLGNEDISRDIPNVSEDALKYLDESGIIAKGTYVKPGDILVGKVTPKGESQVSPEEKLLRAIFGDKAGEVKDVSLRVPPSVYGTVVDVQVMNRRGVDKDTRTEVIEAEETIGINRRFKFEKQAIENARMHNIVDTIAKYELGADVTLDSGKVYEKGSKLTKNVLQTMSYKELTTLDLADKLDFNKKLKRIDSEYFKTLEAAEDNYNLGLKKVKKGDELPAGVLKSVRVFIAIKRKLSVGDKMAGRHGNKGVVSRILPIQDMPYMPDGTPVDIVLNPLGVPSRMNVGQVFEIHLGWAARALGIHVATEVFDGASEGDIKKLLKKAGYQEDGQTVLYDGRTGSRFDQEVTVGVMYMLKLHHLVDTKIHARSTGPYSLVTQQPLGGKAQFGGQRLGEMEVWALEAYGAANVLREMLTVKSDDIEGRTRAYESIVNGNLNFSPGIPESFNVLVRELQGLALEVEFIDRDKQNIDEKKDGEDA